MKGRKKLSYHQTNEDKRQIKEDKTTEHKPKPYQ